MAPVTLAASISEPLDRRAALALSIPSAISPAQLHPHLLASRQSSSSSGSDSNVVPATYPGISPGANGGEVAGITLGVVFGVVLLVWLINSLVNTGRTPVVEESGLTGESSQYRRRSRSRTNRTKSSRRTRSRSVVSRSEMSEVPPLPRTVQRSPRRARETIVIEETRRERPRQVSRPRVVEEEDDIIEVIEEHSPVRRPRRMSGYRNVDPDQYGGGDRPMRKVRR